MDPTGYTSFDKPAYALLEHIACLQHSQKCLQVRLAFINCMSNTDCPCLSLLQLCQQRGASAKPLSTKPKRQPPQSTELSSPYSTLPPLPPLTLSSSSSSSSGYSRRGRRGSSSASLELDHASSSMDGLRLSNSSTALAYARLPSSFAKQSSANKYMGWSDGDFA
jgi:hypothetical protein